MSDWLGSEARRRTKEFGCEVGAIWPDDRPQLAVQSERLEVGLVFQRLEYFTLKLIGKVHLAFD